MPKKPSLESRLIAMQELLANDASRAGQRMTNLENALGRVGEALQDATSRMDKRLGEIERATRRDIADRGGYTFAEKMPDVGSAHLMGRSTSGHGAIDQRAQLRERADELLEQTENQHVFKLDEPRHRVGVDVDLVERVDKALNGEYTAYEPGAEKHSHLLILSTVINLRKRIDQQEKLLRFLVDRAGDGK